MKVGILITSISNFGQKGYYNSQEVGLAKALAREADCVEVYKLVPMDQEKRTELIDKNVRMHLIPARNHGINGVLDVRVLDASMDALVHFSDTQFSAPKAFRWCRANLIRYIPYIGVVESHSTSSWKQRITNYLFRKNLAVYRKSVCCVKTPAVQEKLRAMGVADTLVTPVGLDTDLLRKDFPEYSKSDLKKKYGYQEEEKVLLFIGRLIEEKQPVRMLEILSQIRKTDRTYQLLMVGTGELREAVEKKREELNLSEHVQIMERIPNRDIWELYRLADAFVNLNQQEIFGMAILEAMYYGCKVVAWEAPGPSYIIENGISGWLVRSNAEAAEKILDTTDLSEASGSRILTSFTWQSSAEKILSISGEKTL